MGTSVIKTQVSGDPDKRNKDQTRVETNPQILIQQTTTNMKDLKQQIKDAVTRTTPEGRGQIAFSQREQSKNCNFSSRSHI